MRSRRRNAPSVPATLQRSASASSRRFSLPENCRRLAFATTSGSRRGASSEAISPAALRAPSEAASEEEPSNPFMEDFSNEVMVMSYLYSKLPETGVSPHIGTEGALDPGGTAVPRLTALPMLRSTMKTVSAPAIRSFRGSLPHPTQTLCTLRVRRHRRLTQHSLPGGFAADSQAVDLSPVPAKQILRGRRPSENQ